MPSSGGSPPTTGSFSVHEEFTPAAPRPRVDDDARRSLCTANGDLVLSPGRDGLGDLGKPAFVARRQQHTDFDAETELRFAPAEGEMAGLAALQNDDYFLTFAVVRENGRTMARVARRAGPSDPRSGVTVAEVPVDTRGPIRLQMLARGGRYTFAYSAAAR
jgi:alpha-N-arabinofuranosidase